MNTSNQEWRRRRLGPAGWAAVLLLLAMAACSMPQPPGDTSSAPGTPPVSTPRATTSASAPGAAPPAASAPPSAQATPVPEQPVAVRQGSMEEYPVVASVYPVERNGSMATVNLRLKANKPTQEFAIFESLNDGNPKVLARSVTAPDGVKMVDGAHHQAYLAATTPDGTCLCQPQPTTSRIFPDRTNQVWVSVSFAAPPVDVTHVDVVVPRFGTFAHVPIR